MRTHMGNGVLVLNLSTLGSIPWIDDLFRFSIEKCLDSFLIVIDTSTPQSFFKSDDLIKLIAILYTISIRIYHRRHRSLLYDINIVVYPFCGYNPVLSPKLDMIIKYDDTIDLDEINVERTRNGLDPLTSIIYVPESISTRRTRSATEDLRARFSKLDHTIIRGTVNRSGKYNRVAVGGTFDYLHVGHKLLLSQAFLISNGIVECGVCDGELLKRKEFMEYLQSVEKRKDNVVVFGKMFNPGIDMHVTVITDPYGPTIVERDIDAIVVSRETVGGAEGINVIRAQRNLPLLDIVVVDIISAFESMGATDSKINNTADSKISSKEIRRQLSES